MKRESISIDCVKVTAGKGEVLSECIREAAHLSLEENRIVVLEHNEKLYTADWRVIVDQIYRQHL